VREETARTTTLHVWGYEVRVPTSDDGGSTDLTVGGDIAACGFGDARITVILCRPRSWQMMAPYLHRTLSKESFMRLLSSRLSYSEENPSSGSPGSGDGGARHCSPSRGLVFGLGPS
jgi:hypothetical protein